MKSPNFDVVQNWYTIGLSLRKIGDAVKKGWITSEEFKEITGKDYTE